MPSQLGSLPLFSAMNICLRQSLVIFKTLKELLLIEEEVPECRKHCTGSSGSSNEQWTMFMLQSWKLMKWVLKTDDDKGGQKQCQLSEAQLLSTSLDCKWMLLIMCFADMTYLLCCAVLDLWFRWKWKRKKFALWLVCVSTSAAPICDTSTLDTC